MKNASSKRIAERYVKALFDVANSAGALAAVEADLVSLGSASAQSATLVSFVQNPLYTREQKATAMSAVASKCNAHALTQQFISMLARQNRLELLPAVAELFAQWAQASRGEMSAEVISAAKLGEKEVADVAARLSKAYGKKVNLQLKEDASLIGGVVVRIGSVQLDGSLSGKLRRLKQALAA